MAFDIFEMPLGQGKLAIAPLPGKAGSLAEDVARIEAWGASLVVTLTLSEELEELGVPELPSALMQRGVAWCHWPVRDFDVPDGDALCCWPEVFDTIKAVLRDQGQVLIHCRGGCGRSGMLALRVAVEMGEAPRDALQRLRAVRPCAVETWPQLRWAASATK